MPIKSCKPHLLFIHGGMTFKSRREYLDYLRTREISLEKKERWFRSYLDEKLGHQFEIIRPSMPLSDDAKYEDWKINFERYLTFLRSGDILIGASLGGIFLAKYLSENKLSKKFLSVYLIAPPFDGNLPGEELVGGFRLKSDLSLLEKSCRYLHLLFSENDDVVPSFHAAKYAAKLERAHIAIYPHITGHFKVAEFPEIIKMIKSEMKK